MRIQTVLPELGFAGETFPMQIAIRNDTTVVVKGLILKIYGDATFWSGACFTESKFKVGASLSIISDGFPLAPGASWEANIQMSIPSGMNSLFALFVI